MNPAYFFRRLARADIVFYLLPLIMLNLAAGTLAQRELGLYQAQKMFFSTFITWAGPVPLPGGYILTGILTICLLIKFIFDSQWRFRRAGIILSHMGALILLLGGLVTSLTAKESYLLLAEGDESPYIYDYHARELYVFENDTLIRSISFDSATPNTVIRGLPFTLKFLDRCANCAVANREAIQGEDYRGMAKFMALSGKISEKDPEQNLSGLTFELTGIAKDQDGIYLAIEGMPKPIEFMLQKNGKNKKNYKLMFSKQQRLLPFTVKLQDFQKQTYPGIDMARAYSSDIVITDKGVAWPARVEMNKPLRYKGYTLYQSSFSEADGQQISVLSVVENKGRIFPYIGTFTLALGLLLHLFIMMRERRSL